jgi:monothiol glutaredoxin
MGFDASDATHQQIDGLVKQHDVLLFMKGTKVFPQCGFSATVAGILTEIGVPFHTVNVLADQNIREGIKSYADWPTIPQLYVKGEFVGGCDIVKGLFASGELQRQLGVKVEEVAPPAVTVTDAAAEVLRDAASREKHTALRIDISPAFQYGLRFDADRDGDLLVESNGLTLLFDRGAAKRANGLRLDFSKAEGGFRIDNPNEPPKVVQLPVSALKKALAEDPRLHLYDVRGQDERDIAQIPGARLLNPALREQLLALPKDTALYFHCHHGGRSQAVADQFLAAGFSKVFNIAGGIDAWSREIDPSVPRY